MVADNVRDAIRTAILALREAPEDEVVLREAIIQMVYDLNEDWGRLLENDPQWAYNLVWDERTAEQYENQNAIDPKPVLGILVFVLAVVLGVASLFIK